MRASLEQENPTKNEEVSSLAKVLAPDDIREDGYVAVLYEVCQLPSFFWCEDATLMPPQQPVRIHLIPDDAGIPYRVKSVCLPFVLVEHPAGQHRTLDLRNCQIARLQTKYAKLAWKKLKANKPCRLDK
jgi:hypothetical protein